MARQRDHKKEYARRKELKRLREQGVVPPVKPRSATKRPRNYSAEYAKRNQRTQQRLGVTYAQRRRIVKKANAQGLTAKTIDAFLADLKKHPEPGTDIDQMLDARVKAIFNYNRGNKQESLSWRRLADIIPEPRIETYRELFWYH